MSHAELALPARLDIDEVNMKIFPNKALLVAPIVFLLFTSGGYVSAQDKDWRPLTPSDLTMTSPVVEPSADAEAMFWEVRVDDSSADELALKHYVRIKIFTERGREQFSRHDILYPKGTKIKDVVAKVTKPDGSVVFLKKEDVLEREIVKANGFKIKAKSFALPGLETGSIVEYRYKETIDDGEANMRLIFQREVPIRTISYYVRPFAGDRAMGYHTFNTGDTKFEKDKDGYYRATMTSVPAFREEPNMLPEDEVRSWMYIYYAREIPKTPDEYWAKISKSFYDVSKNRLKPNDEVTAATTQVIAGATTNEDKLRAIFNFTKNQIKNVTYSENVTDDEKKRAASSKSAGDTLKNKIGTAGDIDVLFGAMARAAGFDAKLAFSGNRSEMFFHPGIPNVSLMLGSSNIAVNVGNEWRFFSPASRFTTFGMLSWNEEYQMALIPDQKELIWKPIPLSTADKSLERRTGKFKILDDGTLVGEAKIEYSGHAAAVLKNRALGESNSEREKNFTDLIKSSVLGSAEVDELSIENMSDPYKPLVYTFNIRVPGYASKTGKRIFVQPNVFERNSKPKFVANERKYDVYFRYPFSEDDSFEIEFPAGFTLENADAPGSIVDQNGISSHKTLMTVTPDGRTLQYKRTFSFGNGGYIRFPVQSYPALKTLFEAFNKADVHQLTLRQSAK